MDEILASIRRIIESGEDRTPAAGTQGADGNASARPAESVSTRESNDETLPDSRTQIARFDVHYLPSAVGVSASPEAAEAEPVAPTADGADRSLDRTDLGSAEPGALPEQAPRDLGEERSYALPEAPPSAAPSAAGNENSFHDAAHDPATPPKGAAPSQDYAFEFDDEQFEADLRSGGWDEKAEAAAAAARAMRRADTRPPLPANSQTQEIPESVIDGASALLSAEAGDQVATAFGDLARAIREGHMRSMEEMAREMMRPMLQEWLDDNLPRIVERLVRDEIERVARGARY